MRNLAGCALALIVCGGAHAATTSTTLTGQGTINGITGTSLTATGTASLSGIGSGTFTATLSIGAAGYAGTYTITLSGGTITGTLTLSTSVLTGSGTGSATVTGGSGAYAGATGSFPSLTGTGSISGTSISLSFTGAGTITTGGGGGPTPPSITAVQNNYSYISPGLPNYGIAPGALFIVKGSNLATNSTPVLQSSASPGLPTQLNGASISVTVNGTTVTPGLYYTSSGQLAAVLPSSTPVGTGTITVTVSGTPSAAAPMTVVQSALGIDTYYGTGSGLAVATDANYNLFSGSSSASPGQTIILWGSGVGADTSNTDKVFPENTNNLTNIPMQVWIGGLSANISYRGRSQYPGVDQVVVTIPSGVPPGCNVSVVAVSGTGNIVSNSVTLPIMPGGGTCSDPTSSISPGLLQTLSGKTTVHYGIVAVAQETEQGKVTDGASALFYAVPGSTFASSSTASTPSIGSCVVSSTVISGIGVPTLPTGLNAGTITVTGPGVPTTTLQTFAQVPGVYTTSLTSLPANGGAFTFNGSGGSDVGPFNATVNYPTPLTWTNQSSVTTVNRASGQLVTWTGGATGTYVEITGSSSTTAVTVSFICLAAVSAGQFNIPSWVLLALPPAPGGTLSLGNFTNPTSFTASGLDFAFGYGGTSAGNTVTYQ